MANFKVPYEFVAGTKAKAEEVNTNFSAIKEELNKKLDISENGYITIKDAIFDNHPITKAQFESTKEEINNSIELKIENKALKKTFVIEEGNKDSDCNPDLLDIDDNSKIVFKVDDGTTYFPLKGTLANHTNFIRTSIPDLNVAGLLDGEYNLFVSNEGECIPLANTVFRQKTTPVGIVETPWAQPVLTANGTVGGDKFAVSSTGVYDGEAYLAFDNNSGTRYSQGNSGGVLTIYNPIPIKISTIVVTNTYSNQYYWALYGVEASNDNTNWVTIVPYNTVGQTSTSTTYSLPINSTGEYRYYKISSCGRRILSTQMDINATQSVGSSLSNAVWLDTSVKPYVSKKYNGQTWDSFDYVPLPQNITVKDGAIVSVDKVSNYQINEYDELLSLPDFSRPTVLTLNSPFTAPFNGWICSAKFAMPLYYKQVFIPSEESMSFYPMKGV